LPLLPSFFLLSFSLFIVFVLLSVVWPKKKKRTMSNGNIESVWLGPNCTILFCSPSYSISEGVAPGLHVGSYGSTPQPIPRFQHPSHSLLQDNGFTQQLYHKYHSKCLKGMLTLINTVEPSCATTSCKPPLFKIPNNFPSQFSVVGTSCKQTPPESNHFRA